MVKVLVIVEVITRYDVFMDFIFTVVVLTAKSVKIMHCENFCACGTCIVLVLLSCPYSMVKMMILLFPPIPIVSTYVKYQIAFISEKKQVIHQNIKNPQNPEICLSTKISDIKNLYVRSILCYQL